MYAIEAQTAHPTDRLREGDLLSVPYAGTDGSDKATEKSKFERELASALKELVHEQGAEDESRTQSSATKTTAKDSSDALKAPSRQVRESMLAALSKAIDESPARGGRKRPLHGEQRALDAESSNTTRLAEPGALHPDAKGARIQPKALRGDLEEDRAKRTGRTDSDEDLELLPAVNEDGRQQKTETDTDVKAAETDSAREGAAAAEAKESANRQSGHRQSGEEQVHPRPATQDKAALARARVSGERGPEEPSATARAADERESAQKRRVGDDVRQERGRESARLPADATARHAKKTDKSGAALVTDSLQNRDVVADEKTVDRFERTAPRDDAKADAQKAGIVELEVRDVRSSTGSVSEGETRQIVDVQTESLADSSFQARMRSNSATQARAVLDNLAREVRENLSGDIVRSARIILRANDSGEVRLSLHPKELGRVRVQLQMQDNVLMGRIVVDNSAVREVFEQNLPQLIRAFQESGWETDSLDVSVSDGESGREHGRDNGSGSGSRHAQEMQTEHRDSVEERGLIDVMA